MSRSKDPERVLVYQAADAWVERGLRQDDSLFTPGRSIWTAAGIRDLHMRFVEKPDESTDTFLEKLGRQLRGAPAESMQLMGEILFVHFLIATSVRGVRKREVIREVLDWSPVPVTIPDELSKAMDSGLCNPGMSFNAHRPMQLWQLLHFAEAWKSLDAKGCSGLLADPWQFKQFMFAPDMQVASAQTQRHALLHLVHPDSFEPIVTLKHKKALAETFTHFADGDEEDVDRRLLQIRRAMDVTEGDGFSFYQPELKKQWLPSKAKPAPKPVVVPVRHRLLEHLVPDAGLRAQVADLFAGAIERAHDQSTGAWQCTAQKKAAKLNVGNVQAVCVKQNSIWLTVDRAHLPESARKFVTREGQFQSDERITEVEGPCQELMAIYSDMRTAHFAVIDRQAARYSRSPFYKDHSADLVEEIGTIVGRALPQPELASNDTLEAIEDELCLEVGSLERIERLLEDRRQVILFGPPGTGKTFVARRLADHLARQGGTVEKLQFHPSYAYEDFVEGFRPRLEKGQPSFALVDGPLKRIVARAIENPDAQHVLLIDEINRGNIARVFGELYYLLEYRGDEIRLQYSDVPFLVPENLLIIGTMNTADRSIALVDLALRRRFHFVAFYPDKEPIRGLLRRWLRTNNPDMHWVAKVVDLANRKLDNRDTAIGPSYFLQADLDEESLELVWEHSILPYLAEQFAGNKDRLKEFSLLRLRQEAGVTATEVAEGPSADA